MCRLSHSPAMITIVIAVKKVAIVSSPFFFFVDKT